MSLLQLSKIIVKTAGCHGQWFSTGDEAERGGGQKGRFIRKQDAANTGGSRIGNNDGAARPRLFAGGC